MQNNNIAGGNVLQKLRNREAQQAEQQMADDPGFWARLSGMIPRPQAIPVQLQAQGQPEKKQMGGYTTPKTLRRQQLDEAFK